MAEPVAGHADGVLLRGCHLPQAWAGQPQWRILDTHFGLGLNFLKTWLAWRQDARRPRLLHLVAVQPQPAPVAALLAAAGPDPELAELASLLAAQWHALLPGLHRLAFDDGRVLLTVCIGELQPMLRAQRFEADSIYLHEVDPPRTGPAACADTLKAVARFARPGTRLATRNAGPGPALRAALVQNGFRLPAAAGPPRTQDPLEAEFAPSWTVRRRQPAAKPATPGHCAVVGAGLAGAAVAASLARRGWRVTVLEAADRPAAGASGVPVALFAPHVSPDDALLSRLTRAGLRMTRQQLEDRLVHGTDWFGGGVIERRAPGDDRLPRGWKADGPNSSWHVGPGPLRQAALPADTCALWHADAGWAKPAALIAAWLQQPGIEVQCGRRVVQVLPADPDAADADAGWALHGAQGELLLEADRVVIAAGHHSAALAPGHPLQPVRGQVAWGAMALAPGLPRIPINGDGHLIAQVPDAAGAFWLTGASFERDAAELGLRAEDTAQNRARLERLHPAAGAQLAGAFDSASVQAWAGVRCASADRRPLLGPLDPAQPQGPWLCSALGSRGLSFAVLCAELLAAQWHAEPLPLPEKLAQALSTARLRH